MSERRSETWEPTSAHSMASRILGDATGHRTSLSTVSIAFLLLALTLVAFLASGCGGQSKAAIGSTSSASPACVLSAAQHRDIVRAKREIIRMHRLEQPLKTWHPKGPAKLELAVNRFLLDVGPLPVGPKEQLMNMGKSAVGLCGDCFNALEAEEPAAQTRLGHSPCAAR
jgi:hypothetical protein